MKLRDNIHAHEARQDRRPHGPNDDCEAPEPDCYECDDSGLVECGCMTFAGPLDDCTSCEGDGCDWCDCDAGEARRAAWAAKVPDYYDRDYSARADIWID